MSSVFLSRTSQAATANAPDVGEGVDHQVIEHRAGGLRVVDRDARRRHADQDVAGMRDRRVGQHPLEVPLRQRGEVAVGHRHGRDHGDDPQPARAHDTGRRVRPGPQRVQEHLHQRHEAGELRAGGDPGRDRRRGAFVGVGRPLVERHRRHLEPEADQHQQDRRRPRDIAGEARFDDVYMIGDRPRRDAAQHLADRLEVGRPRQAVEHAQPEEEQRRGDRAVDEVLQPALGRPPPRLLDRRAR